MDFSYTNMLAQLNVGSAHPGGASATQQAWHKINSHPHDVILDAGCGTGKTLAYLAETTKSRLFGIDNNDTMIAKAKQRLKNSRQVDLILADITDLPFPNETIDCILSESVTSFVDITVGLKEYHRVLREHGILCLIEITAKDPLSANESAEINGFYGTHSILTKSEWQDAINEAGFCSIDCIRLPATTEGNADIDMQSKVDPIYFEFLAHHYHLIEKIHDQLIGYLFLCQKCVTERD
ncbi:class I SAM-dependent methyltransferase [Amphibacillus sp. Q70]|uniref:class I SAM-dependent methyltransferase n=1 Tax=Amphibacillus sp. Q70 TaxID=3453416 RepID=UPI003F868CE9